MSNPETSPPIPQFEVPSDLLELQRRIQERTFYWGGLEELKSGLSVTLAAIPTMVEEIGRLNNGWHEANVECLKNSLEAARLRALNAELREALKDLHDDCVEYARINNLHNADGSPATNHAMRRASAILTKSESQSAPSQCGDDLPAQESPSVIHRRPAPGGTSTETQTR